MSGGWGCPHEIDGLCQRVNGAICEPGMRGCVLDGKVTFPDGRPHRPRWPSRVVGEQPSTASEDGPGEPRQGRDESEDRDRS